MEAQAAQDAQQLKLLSIFHYIVAGMMALFGSFPLFHLLMGVAMVAGKFGPPKASDPSEALVGWFFIIFAGVWIALVWTLAVCTVIAGRSLAKRQRHVFCVVVAGLMAATCMPFGTVLGVFTIIVLMRPSVKEAFGVPQ